MGGSFRTNLEARGERRREGERGERRRGREGKVNNKVHCLGIVIINLSSLWKNNYLSEHVVYKFYSTVLTITDNILA